MPRSSPWRLLTAVSQPMDFNGQQVVSGISIGIATSATDGDQADQLLKNADLALYRAKADGRGTFRFFEAEMDARAQARRALEIDLRQALVKEQFELHYQPQVDIETNEIIGVRGAGALAPSGARPRSSGRVHPARGRDRLIIRPRRVGASARLRGRETWPDTIKVAVNVSPAQFRNHDLAAVRRADPRRKRGSRRHRLEIEITESLLLRDVEANLSDAATS